MALDRFFAWTTVAVACLWLAAATGCGGRQPGTNSQPTTGTGSGGIVAAELQILVVDDAPLAESLRRWKKEWQALAGAGYEVVSAERTALSDDWPEKFDVVVYPAELLGTLAEQKQLQPLRLKLLEAENYQTSDLFPLVWEHEVRWAAQPLALPLGTPVFTLAYRADLLKSAQLEAPRTWEEYEKLVQHFQAAPQASNTKQPDMATASTTTESDAWQAACEPLADGWAGRVLLARAAAYAQHRSQLSTLFDRDSMEPLVESEAFERALSALVAAVGPRSLSATPADALQELLAGRCLFALTWIHPPGAEAAADRQEAAPMSREVAFAELPGAREMYNRASRQWDTRERDQFGQVTLLGVAGRLASVTHGSKNAPSAMRFLAWLTQSDVSGRICTASAATTLFRETQASQSAPWIGREVSTDSAQQYVETLSKSLSKSEFLLAPRIPGAERYMAALDESVRAAASGKQAPAVALANAAARWREITQELGTDQQRAAYRRSLGEAE